MFSCSSTPLISMLDRAYFRDPTGKDVNRYSKDSKPAQ